MLFGSTLTNELKQLTALKSGHPAPYRVITGNCRDQDYLVCNLFSKVLQVPIGVMDFQYHQTVSVDKN